MSRKELTDEELSQLARRAAGGDGVCAEKLFVELLPRVRNLVRYLVRGDSDVDDLSQEALVLILRGMHGYRGEGAFRSWADRIVARCVFAHLKRVRRPALGLAVAVASPSPEVASQLPPADAYTLRRQVAVRLDALPDAQRSAMVLHYVVGMTVPEVARELGAPEETVRSRLRLARDRLRQQLTASRDRMVG